MTKAAPTSALLEIADLHVAIDGAGGRKEVVSGASLSVRAGEVLAVVGESGSGKTMTMAAVLDLLPRPAACIVSGSIRFDGNDLLALGSVERRRILRTDIAFITQNSLTSLNPVRTVRRQLAEMIAFRNEVGKKEALDLSGEWLAKVGIADVDRVLSSYPHNLSGGMRQRVVIAMAISSRPKLLIADEPTTALDTITQKQVLDLLRDINRSFGTALLLITHDFGVVSYLSRRVAVMYRGRVVETGNTLDVLTNPKDGYSRDLIGSVPELDFS